MNSTLLDETLEAWHFARQGVIDECRNIPAKHFGVPPAPDVKSPLELARHILEVAMLMTGELTRPDTNLQRKPWPAMLRTYGRAAQAAKTKAEVIKLLTAQLREAERAFRAAGELSLYQMIRRFDGKHGTKLTWMQHGIAHEEYHRGQLALYARLLGIEPALTKRIRGG